MSKKICLEFEEAGDIKNGTQAVSMKLIGDIGRIGKVRVEDLIPVESLALIALNYMKRWMEESKKIAQLRPPTLIESKSPIPLREA